MNLESIPWGFGASTITFQHHSGLAIAHIPKIQPPPALQRPNSVPEHPYAHRLHIEVLKHFLYI